MRMPVSAMVVRLIMPLMSMIGMIMVCMVMRVGLAMAVLAFFRIHLVYIPLVLECLHAPQRGKKDSRP